MAQLDVRRTYADGEILLASDLDSFLDDIETFLNITRINDDNIQDSSITASSKLSALSVTTAKIANEAITTAKIADLAVTTAKLNDLAVTTAKIADLNITTGKIVDGSITTAKLSTAALGSIRTLSNVTLSGSGTWTVPANVYTLHVELLGSGKTFGATTFTNPVDITRLVATAPGVGLAYNALAGIIIVWY